MQVSSELGWHLGHKTTVLALDKLFCCCPIAMQLGHLIAMASNLVAFLLLVAMPGAPSSFLLVVRPGAPSSVRSLRS